MEQLRILPAGDLSLVVEFGNEISADCNKKVNQLNSALKKRNIKGIIETVPTFRSLLIYYDPCILTYQKLTKYINKYTKEQKEVTSGKIRTIEIPVCYGGCYGEDLFTVANHANVSEEEVIRLHSSVDYLIYMLGFLPGFPYLGGLNECLHTPRLSNPRTLIPAGSVGIGGEQTGVYPIASPGGWRLIGRTPLKLYDKEREQPTLYKAGDFIRFRPICNKEYEEILIQVENGTYQYKISLRGE